MILGKYSVGIGDRFGRQGKAQLRALVKAGERGVLVTPVWNKSNREHSIVGTSPRDVRAEADGAVESLGWKESYFVDADHIGMKNVDPFIDPSDFFTIDVADCISRPPDGDALRAFVASLDSYAGALPLDGADRSKILSRGAFDQAARKFLLAVQEAGKVYRHIEQKKGKGKFVTEVSMDESAEPQSAVEIFVILAAIAREDIPIQTIAPRFSGRFNKGVDYVGDAERFAQDFRQDLAAVRFASREFPILSGLKLSIHSGSDKFSIYRPMNEALNEFGAGVHLKTAGTTWLEEVIGLALAGGNGLIAAREIYAGAFARIDELCAPYATVIDIDRTNLPAPRTVAGWDEDRFVSALRHDPSCPSYNPDLRQLLHVGYKVAAEMGPRYLRALEECEDVIADSVTMNLYERHIEPLFIADSAVERG